MEPSYTTFWHRKPIATFETRLWLALACFCLAGCSKAPVSSDLPDKVDYNFHIKPILSDRCYTCHGPDENTRQAGLKLFTEAGAKTDPLERGGRAIVPGSLRKSKLYRRIVSDDPAIMMPPPESNLHLTEHEKALIARWIKQGAEWKNHWSFIPPEKPAPPDVQQASWPHNAIDTFLLARMEREGLHPQPEAPKETLLRRVTFDLTGLPPTLEALDAFLADTTANAYKKVVDRLLSSTAYGEHMAAGWMDVARYADTHGYQADRERRMWPWRDWVIDAFNNNMGYDDFLTWQLAGDLLPGATQEQHLATAFNRNHRQTEEGGSIEEEFRVEYVADRTNTTATAFLGLTMECARCHDHKYDPISQQEYYEFFSFFSTIDESGQTSHFTDAVPVPTLLLPDQEAEQKLKILERQIVDQKKKLATIAKGAKDAFAHWRRPAVLPVPGLVAAYTFDEKHGDKLPNHVAPNLPGATHYSPLLTEGHTGGALQFDGENGVIFENVGAFTRADPFTLSLWVKADTHEKWNVLVHRTQAALDAGSRGYELSLKEGKLVGGLTHMWPENAIRLVSQDQLPLDSWVHLAMTYDGTSRADGVHLYMNGQQLTTRTVRDNLLKNITYERVTTHLTMGYRFRDTGFKNGLIDDFRVYNRTLTAVEVAQISGNPSSNQAALLDYYLATEHAAYREAYTTLHLLRKEQNKTVSPIPEIMVMREMDTPRPNHILIRGQYDDKGDTVTVGTPRAILPLPDSLARNRLGLAHWLVHPKNPLAARVAVNRYWQRYFGTGIVATPEDFGNQGALPTHPELLDHLAVTFMESGWDVKALQRRIVMSNAYRQAASPPLEHDPDNRLLASGPHLRLTAEMIRDAALATSGLLIQKTGGPSVRPYQPAGLWKEKSGRTYVPGTGEDLYRRSLYTFFKRTSPPPSMITFDMPMRSQCIMRRQRTATPMQALVLLNDPQYVEAARHIAERMVREGGGSADARIDVAFRLLTSRLPTDRERNILRTLYGEQHALFAQDHAAALALLHTGESPYDTSLDPVDLSASSVVASTVMNFNEAITK